MTLLNCKTCNKELNQQNDPSSRDCGGDCVECMAEAGDPDCKLVMYDVLKARLAAAEKDVSRLLFRDTGVTDDVPRFLLVRNGQPVLNEQQQLQFFTFGSTHPGAPTPVIFQNGLPLPQDKQKQGWADLLQAALRG